MEYLWSRGYVHSDIKPQNILVKDPNVDRKDTYIIKSNTTN
jgi:serine/threonine protein kinase